MHANGVRRTMTAEEKTATLVNIIELSGWSPRKMAEKLPFSYEWIMKFLPFDYKNREKSAAGKLGGRPRIESTEPNLQRVLYGVKQKTTYLN